MTGQIRSNTADVHRLTSARRQRHTVMSRQAEGAGELLAAIAPQCKGAHPMGMIIDGIAFAALVIGQLAAVVAVHAENKRKRGQARPRHALTVMPAHTGILVFAAPQRRKTWTASEVGPADFGTLNG